VPRPGLFFQGPDGRPQLVSIAALKETFGAAGASVKLVVLNACYSEVQAEALLTHVDCIVGMSGSIHDDVARSFAIGFYGGLGERESVAAAYKQGCAAISLEGLPDSNRPQLKIRAGVVANQLIPAAARLPKLISRNKIFVAIALGFVLLGVLVYTELGEYRNAINVRGKLRSPLGSAHTGSGEHRNAAGPLKIDDVIIKEANPVVIDVASHDANDSDGRSDGSSSETSTSWRHIVLDVRIRNDGRSTVNLTRATLKGVPGVQEAWCVASSYEPSAVYKISSQGFVFLGQETPSTSMWNFRPWTLLERSRRSEMSFPVAHVLKPDEVDNFIIEANIINGINVQLVLTYNGGLTVASREISFACLH